MEPLAGKKVLSEGMKRQVITGESREEEDGG